MGLNPLRYRKVNEPPPPDKRLGKPTERRDAVYAMLAGMQVGDAIEVELTRPTLEVYVYRWRVANDRARRFKVRATDRLGSSKIWRVA